MEGNGCGRGTGVVWPFRFVNTIVGGVHGRRGAPHGVVAVDCKRCRGVPGGAGRATGCRRAPLDAPGRQSIGPRSNEAGRRAFKAIWRGPHQSLELLLLQATTGGDGMTSKDW